MSEARSFLPFSSDRGMGYGTSEQPGCLHRWPYPTVGLPVGSLSARLVRLCFCKIEFVLLTDIRAETLKAGDQVYGGLVDCRPDTSLDTRDGADKEESVGGELNHFELLKIKQCLYVSVVLL